VSQFLLEQIQSAKHHIQIISPYYYPLKKLDKELLGAVARGVKVELITARNRDIPSYRNFVNANLMNHLVRNGVHVLQVKDKYLHMKGILFDDQVLTFGRPRSRQAPSTSTSGAGTTTTRSTSARGKANTSRTSRKFTQTSAAKPCPSRALQSQSSSRGASKYSSGKVSSRPATSS
jgi:hypothetical protein